MLRKRIIGVFLIMVFMIPVLPIAQVGVLLGTNGLTEEISHSHAGDGPVKMTGKEVHVFTLGLVKPDIASIANKKWATDEEFLTRQADDIQTPPPNI